MLAAIIRFSLTQRVFVVLISMALLLAGSSAWFSLPIDAFPDISPTQVKVILKAPGMTAEEIESQITVPIETELLGIPNQQILRSMTKYAITDITIDFVEGTDIYWARQQVSERLSNVMSSLPEGLEGGVAPMSTPLSEMFMFSLENPNMTLLEKRQILDWEVRPLLRSIDGVADVNILGGFAKTFQISPDPLKLASAGISFQELANSIYATNKNANIGRIEVGNDTLIIRSEGRVNTLEAIGNIVISSDFELNSAIRLKDVAKLDIGHLARYGAVTRNGVETAEAIVISLKDSNTAEVIKNVTAKLSEIENSLPPNTELNVFYNRKNLIDTAIGTIEQALLIAIVLVIIVLSLFLGDLRAAIAVSLVLPLAAAGTFILMQLVDYSANLMSLGGLVIAIGMLVDASVVVVENTVNNLKNNKGLPKLHLIYRACKDVAGPVVSGTVIVIIVFSPLLTLTGLEGKLFTPVAVTIVFAMISSLLLSLTVIPAFTSFLLNNKETKEPKFLKVLKDSYQRLLTKTIPNPKYVIVGSMACLILSIIFFNFLGKTFMPVLDEGDIIVQLEKSPSISLQASTDLDIQIEKALLANIPEIKQIVSRVGSDELGLDPMSLNETDIFMELAPTEEWRFGTKEELKDAIREVLSEFPGINIGFTQPIQMRVSEMLTGSSGAVTVKIFGDNITELSQLSAQISTLTKGIDGSVDVNASVIEGGDFLTISLKPEIAKDLGISITELSTFVKSQLEQVQISDVIEGKKKTPIVFASHSSDPYKPSNIADIRNMNVLLPNSTVLPLQAIANISFKEGPIMIERENGYRFAAVTSNVKGRDVVGFVSELQTEISEQISLPVGYTVDFGGEFENQQRASSTLLLVVPIALGLIMLILFTTFGSISKAILILANVPFAIMGGIIALFISQEFLSVPASVGFIALLGVAVLNGVVMVSYFEQTKEKVSDLVEGVIEGSKRRLRPVLMTALTAMFGLLPLVIATGPGAEIQKPLAIVVVGGLFTSTFTTLFLIPVFYIWMERRNATN